VVRDWQMKIAVRATMTIYLTLLIATSSLIAAIMKNLSRSTTVTSALTVLKRYLTLTKSLCSTQQVQKTKNCSATRALRSMTSLTTRDPKSNHLMMQRLTRFPPKRVFSESQVTRPWTRKRPVRTRGTKKCFQSLVRQDPFTNLMQPKSCPT